MSSRVQSAQDGGHAESALRGSVVSCLHSARGDTATGRQEGCGLTRVDLAVGCAGRPSLPCPLGRQGAILQRESDPVLFTYRP